MPDVEGKVLDVGCGYGPIGISVAAILIRQGMVDMLILMRRAVETFKGKCKLNGSWQCDVFMKVISLKM